MICRRDCFRASKRFLNPDRMPSFHPRSRVTSLTVQSPDSSARLQTLILRRYAQSFDAILSESIHYLVVDFFNYRRYRPLQASDLCLVLRQRLRDRHGDVILCAMRPRLERLQKVLGLDGYFTTAPDSESALQSLKNSIEGVYPLSVRCPACDTLIDIERPGRGRCQTCEAVITAFSRWSNHARLSVQSPVDGR